MWPEGRHDKFWYFSTPPVSPRVSVCPCDPPGPPGLLPHTAGRSPHSWISIRPKLSTHSSHSPGASIGLNAELWLPWEQSDANLAGSDWFLLKFQLASCVAGGGWSHVSGNQWTSTILTGLDTRNYVDMREKTRTKYKYVICYTWEWGAFYNRVPPLTLLTGERRWLVVAGRAGPGSGTASQTQYSLSCRGDRTSLSLSPPHRAVFTHQQPSVSQRQLNLNYSSHFNPAHWR